MDVRKEGRNERRKEGKRSKANKKNIVINKCTEQRFASVLGKRQPIQNLGSPR